MKKETFHEHYDVEELLSLDNQELCSRVTHPDGTDAARLLLTSMLRRGVTCHVISAECDLKNLDGSCAGHRYTA